jgi:hypothetical protein
MIFSQQQLKVSVSPRALVWVQLVSFLRDEVGQSGSINIRAASAVRHVINQSIDQSLAHDRLKCADQRASNLFVAQ